VSAGAPLDPAVFGPAPARDARFVVKERWTEMENFPAEDPRHPLEFLHRQMNEEVNSLEISARNLADFPDADWELRLSMARQCWDEARHVVMFRRCLEARGGHVGDHPVLNFQYRIIASLPDLAGRLAVQNRSFEAAGIDAINDGLGEARGSGQPDLVELLDAQLADEVQHVRFANVWVPRLVDRGGARATFALVQAVARADGAMREVAGAAMTTYPVAEDIRREAGFSEAEIATVRRITAGQ
jgi:uncharacterized ferritin-like protein (DUF455 family)